MKIQIKNARNPFCFWGIKDGSGSSPRFLALQREIDDYFGNDQLYKSVLTNPVAGMKCVVHYEAKLWQRAVVESVLVTPYGCKVRCFLVDLLEVQLVESNRLFVSPSWVWDEPTQGLKFSLYGITPTCLWTDYHKDEVEIRSHETRWDSSATKYFKELIYLAGSKGLVDIVSVDENKVHHVYLYLTMPKMNPVSIADLLINKKFALPISEARPVATVTSPIVKSPKFNISQQSLEMSNSLDKLMQEVSDCLNDSDSTGSNPSPKRPNTSPCSKNLSNSKDEVVASSIVHDMPASSKDQSLFTCNLSAIQSHNTNSSFSTIPAVHNNAKSAQRANSFDNKKSKSHLNGVVKGSTLSSMVNNISLDSDHTAQKLEIKNRNGFCETGANTPSRNVSNPGTTPVSPVLLNTLHEISKISGGGEHVVTYTVANKQDTKKKFLLIEKLLAEAKQVLDGEGEDEVKPVGNRSLTMEKDNSNELDMSAFAGGDTNKDERRGFRPSLGSPQPDKKSESTFSVNHAPSMVTRNHCSILVKGYKPPNPYPLFCKTPFPSFITGLLESLKFRGPTQVQAHAWPAIMEKRNLVALAPSGGGKTLAYVAPLVSMLCKHKAVAKDIQPNPLDPELTHRKNPEIVVLCSSWKDVQSVTDCFKSFLNCSDKPMENHQVVGICGGPAVESKRAVELVTGCRILVVSPHTLIRICQAKYISLNKLEYLVLDSMHVLVEEFTEEVSKIMQMWSIQLFDPDRPPIHRYKPKIFGFGIQWTKGIKSFMDAYMTDPLLYINHPLEAAVFGKVHHTVHIWSREKSFDCLVELVQSVISNRNGGIGIFVRFAATMRKIMVALTCASIHCVGVEGAMMSVETQDIQKQFHDEASTAPVLIISIHFELAKDKFVFGLRLGFMQYFYQMQDEKKKPRSHIFLTNENIGEVMGVTKLLQRLSQPIPPLLQILANKTIQSGEAIKDRKGLCPFLKAYGNCRDSLSCVHRHYVNQHLDLPNTDLKFAKVPTDGFVKFKVTCVVNATLFYGHVIKCNSQEVMSSNKFNIISQKMDQYSKSADHERLLGLPKFGQVFAFRSSDTFYRAILKKPIGHQRTGAWKSPAGLTKLRICMVDTGKSCTATLDSLYRLPQTLAAYPFQAIEIQACCVKPIDKDLFWPVQANECVHDMIYDKTVEGKVVLALGHTVWLRPVLIRSNLPISAVRITDCNVMAELLRSGLAEKNPDHIKNLHKKCEVVVMAMHLDSAESEKTKPEPSPAVPTSHQNNSPTPPLKSENHSMQNGVENQPVLLPPVSGEIRCGETFPRPSSAENLPCRELSSRASSQSSATRKSHILYPDTTDSESSLSSKMSSNTRLTSLKEVCASSSRLSCLSSLSGKSTNEVPEKSMTSDVEVSLLDIPMESCPEKQHSLSSTSLSETSLPSAVKTSVDDSTKDLSDVDDAKSISTTSSSMVVASLSKSSTDESGDVKPDLSGSISGFLSQDKKSSKTDTVSSNASTCTPTYNPNNECKTVAPTPLRHNECILKPKEHPILAKDMPKTESLPLIDELKGQDPDTSDGLLHPLCVRLAHSVHGEERLQACQELYMAAREMPCDVTERDIKTLKAVLYDVQGLEEQVLILGSFLALAIANVPLSDHISLTDLIAALGKVDQNTSVDGLTLALGKMMIQNALQELVQLIRDLLLYFNREKLKSSAVTVALELVDYALAEVPSLLKEIEDVDLANLLMKLKPCKEHEHLKRSIFVKIVSHKAEQAMKVSDAEVVSEVKVEVKEQPKKTTTKRMDCLNYDRFNDIDTDTESAASRPYTPVPIRFEMDIDTATVDTDTDNENDLFGI